MMVRQRYAIGRYRAWNLECVPFPGLVMWGDRPL